MKATHNLPKQVEIEEFLGREFFPKYKNAVSLSELVDLVQLEFQISDEDRQVKCPTGHGSDGTILECLVRFALLRLEEMRCVVNIGQNTFRVGGSRFVGTLISRRDYNAACYWIKLMRDSGTDKETAMIYLAGRYSDDTIEKAAQKIYETVLA